MLKLLTAATLAALAAPSLAGATLLTDIADYAGPGLDLSDFRHGTPDFTFGPLDVDGYSFTAAPGEFGSFDDPYGGTTGFGSFVGQDVWLGYGLDANGYLFGDFTILGLDSGLGTMQLLGQTGYSQLGFLMNYAPGWGDDPTIWTLDQAGNVIDSFNLAALAPISTPDLVNAFQFRGVGYDDGTEIYGMRFGGSYMVVTDTPAGTAIEGPGATGNVPEPASWMMLIAGFGLVGAAARRRRAARAQPVSI